MKVQTISPVIWTRRKIIVTYLLGPMLILLGLLIYIINPLNLIVNSQMSFRDGSLLYNLWQKPPVEILISVYMYNYTNFDIFDKGLEAKLRIKQIGPYVYQEILEYTNVTFNDNDTVTFVPKRLVKFRPDLSVGDPNIDIIIAPNIPYMGATAAVSERSALTSIALRTLTGTLGSKAMLQMPIHDYLWGYKDPLVRLASKLLPFFIDFEQFGLMERVFSEGHNVVNMHIPTRNPETIRNNTQGQQRERDFSINTWNYEKTIHFWTPGRKKRVTDCNRVYGTFDGTLFPPHMTPGDEFRIYRKAFCRTLPIVYTHSTTFNGVEVYNFQLHDRAFDSSIQEQNSSCYCPNGRCMKKGLGNVTPCYYHMPLAISLPHFYKSDPSLLNLYEGFEPSQEKHDTIIYIEPKLGVPIHLKGRFQMNLVLNNLGSDAKLIRFRNKVVPIFWLEIGLNDLPQFLKLLITMLYKIGPILQYGAIIILILGGLTIIAYVFFTQDPKTIYSPVKTLKLLPLKQNLHQCGDEARASLIMPSMKVYELDNLTELELEPPLNDDTEDSDS